MSETTPKTITREMALEAMAAAVEEKGADHRYRLADYGGSCVYAHQGETACLVGDALHRLGVPIDVLEPIRGSIGTSHVVNVLNPHVRIESAALGAFRTAQAEQDCGSTWGIALMRASSRLRHL